MIDHLLQTAGHWSDTAARQNIISQAARILACRGAEHWPETCERLRSRLHLAPGILEHQTLTESTARDHNPTSYALDRIDDINKETRAHNAKNPPTNRRQTPDPRPLPTPVPDRPEQHDITQPESETTWLSRERAP